MGNTVYKASLEISDPCTSFLLLAAGCGMCVFIPAKCRLKLFSDLWQLFSLLHDHSAGKTARSLDSFLNSYRKQTDPAVTLFVSLALWLSEKVPGVSVPYILFLITGVFSVSWNTLGLSGAVSQSAVILSKMPFLLG